MSAMVYFGNVVETLFVFAALVAIMAWLDYEGIAKVPDWLAVAASLELMLTVFLSCIYVLIRIWA